MLPDHVVYPVLEQAGRAVLHAQVVALTPCLGSTRLTVFDLKINVPLKVLGGTFYRLQQKVPAQPPWRQVHSCHESKQDARECECLGGVGGRDGGCCWINRPLHSNDSPSGPQAVRCRPFSIDLVPQDRRILNGLAIQVALFTAVCAGVSASRAINADAAHFAVAARLLPTFAKAACVCTAGSTTIRWPTIRRTLS